MKKLKIPILVLLLWLLSGTFWTSISYHYVRPRLPESFEQFHQERIVRNRALGVRPGNADKLLRFGEYTQKVILYIPGYGATRAEGEYITDRLAERLKANTYYLRLPGHGVSKEDMEASSAQAMLEDAETVFLMMPQLGDKLILVGTSMGGLIATYLAGKYPERVDKLVLFSPFYDFAARAAVIMKFPGGLKLAELMEGRIRKWDVNDPKDPDRNRYSPDIDKFWLTEKYTVSLRHLVQLHTLLSGKDYFEKITSPVMLFYYYKDGNHQDTAASVASMLTAFQIFPSKNKQAVAVADGNHILASSLVRTDKKLIEEKLKQFLP